MCCQNFLKTSRKLKENLLCVGGYINSLESRTGGVSCTGKFRCKLPLCGVQCTLWRWMHSFLDIAMLYWVGFLNSHTSSDAMGYLQGVQMKLVMWVNSRNEPDCCRLGDNWSAHWRNECHHYRSKRFNTVLLPTVRPVCCLTGMRRLEVFLPSSLREEIVLL